jgi:acyl-CoA hydrolase
MVALDAQQRPRDVRTLTPTTPEERRRQREALIRREHRLARRQAILASRG